MSWNIPPDAEAGCGVSSHGWGCRCEDEAPWCLACGREPQASHLKYMDLHSRVPFERVWHGLCATCEGKSTLACMALLAERLAGLYRGLEDDMQRAASLPLGTDARAVAIAAGCNECARIAESEAESLREADRG